MKKTSVVIAAIIVATLVFLPIDANASLVNSYYGNGSYISSAPVTPLTGLEFYVDYSAVSRYGSSVFTSAFDWNGDYRASVSTMVQYPASSTAYPDNFLIHADPEVGTDIAANTFYYTASGDIINDTEPKPMDTSHSIAWCRIGLNTNSNFFQGDSAWIRKTIIHEVGHVFLLMHPSGYYFNSVMHRERPDGGIKAYSVTTNDRNNLIEKWGY